MTVLFGYSLDFEHVTTVYWEQDGIVKMRVLRGSGMAEEDMPEYQTLAQLKADLGRGVYVMYPAVVGDLRSAFKYLGKSTDLVETLPEVDLAEADSGAV